MGYSLYDTKARALRAETEGYSQKSLAENFRQRSMHQDMDPRNVKFRECRDSENHPFSLPVQIYLDVTGSMGAVPQQLITEGLPKMISNLLNKGIKSPAIMFGAVGDHECDKAPLQVSQFESGDEELDGWLSKTWIEGGGGGNSGESYGLAWYFAGHHVVSDAWEKRNQKGYVFTIGDEPNLQQYPGVWERTDRGLRKIMGSAYEGGKAGYSASTLLAKAKERNHVYHIFISHGYSGMSEWIDEWKRKMGPENVLVVDSHIEIPDLIFRTILSNEGALQKAEGQAQLEKILREEQEEIIL